MRNNNHLFMSNRDFSSITLNLFAMTFHRGVDDLGGLSHPLFPPSSAFYSIKIQGGKNKWAT